MKNEKLVISFIFYSFNAQFPSRFVSRNPGGEDHARQAQRHQFDPIKKYSTRSPFIPFYYVTCLLGSPGLPLGTPGAFGVAATK